MLPSLSLGIIREPQQVLAPASDVRALVERFCDTDDLSTYDPYDIWKTRLGYAVKNLYNRSRAYAVLAAPFAIADLLNSSWRLFYSRQEYPIVRAFAALSLMNLYERHGGEHLLVSARRHLEWLVEHRCSGCKGYGWGLGFRHTVSRTVAHEADTPFSVITPYPLEAFARYIDLTAAPAFQPVLDGIYRFFDEDVQVMYEDNQVLATSYGPCRDRIVHNASSYSMYSYSLFLPSASTERRDHIVSRIQKLYRFLVRAQRMDGSWLYSPEGRSFVDCFHSCIILKNLIKTNRRVPLAGCSDVVAAGYKYLKRAMLDERICLMRRFSVRNKPGLISFDLYDSAEMLNLAHLVGDAAFAGRLQDSVFRHFWDGESLYSQIDLLGMKRNKNTLRWAAMPFVYALSNDA